MDVYLLINIGKKQLLGEQYEERFKIFKSVDCYGMLGGDCVVGL
jgi:hypothetical protein